MHFSALTPGYVFAGDYAIVSRLSEGGMGAVYVAEQQSTKKHRALKLMLPSLIQDAKLRERFVTEAQVGSKIQSEHVVEVVGAGLDAATGLPWLAMELLEGDELGRHLRARGPLPPREVLEIIRQACHGLGAAHRVGIVHRDLKPENLFLARSRRADAASTVKILDFGIAKLTAEAKTSATDTMGSPMWMAPEQSQRGAPVSPATDVWALGLIVFRMLTGKCYWLSLLDAEPSALKLMREMVIDPMPRPVERAAELGVAELLPPGFDGWFSRACDRDPAGRFAHADDAFQALERCLSGAGAPALAAGALVTAPASVMPVATEWEGSPIAVTGAPAPPSAPGRSRWLLPVIGGGAAATAIAVAVAMSSSSSTASTPTGSVPVVVKTPVTKERSVVASVKPPAPAPSVLPAFEDWQTDIDRAIAQGRAEGRPVLLDFGADWCAACKEFRDKTFASENFRASATRFIPVPVDLTEDEADNPTNKAIRDKWKVKGLPVVVLLKPTGEEFARVDAFTEPERMLSVMAVVD